MPLIYSGGAQEDATGTTPLTLSPTIPTATVAGDTLVVFAAGDMSSTASSSLAMGSPAGWTSLGSAPTGVSYLSWGSTSADSSIVRTPVTDTSTNIDVKALCRRADWTPASGNSYIASDRSSGINWGVYLSASGLNFIVRSDTATAGVYTTYTVTADAATMGFVDGEWSWLRVTFDVANQVRFWTSGTGSSWTMVQQTSLPSDSYIIQYAVGDRYIQVGASDSASGTGWNGDIGACRVSSSTNSMIADLGLFGLSVPSATGWTAPEGTVWSTKSTTSKSWTGNGAGAIYGFWRTASSGLGGTTASFTFPGAFAGTGLKRSVRLIRLRGSTTGPGAVMTDKRQFEPYDATWQPANIAAPATISTFLMAEYRSVLATVDPIVTANLWWLDRGTLAGGRAGTFIKENATATVSPVLVSSAGVRAALGIGFATSANPGWISGRTLVGGVLGWT